MVEIKARSSYATTLGYKWFRTYKVCGNFNETRVPGILILVLVVVAFLQLTRYRLPLQRTWQAEKPPLNPNIQVPSK